MWRSGQSTGQGPVPHSLCGSVHPSPHVSSKQGCCVSSHWLSHAAGAMSPHRQACSSVCSGSRSRSRAAWYAGPAPIPHPPVGSCPSPLLSQHPAQNLALRTAEQDGCHFTRKKGCSSSHLSFFLSLKVELSPGLMDQRGNIVIPKSLDLADPRGVAQGQSSVLERVAGTFRPQHQEDLRSSLGPTSPGFSLAERAEGPPVIRNTLPQQGPLCPQCLDPATIILRPAPPTLSERGREHQQHQPLSRSPQFALPPYRLRTMLMFFSSRS